MNVSRNDFRPPPQVESSVIRLVPIDPPPPIKFEEIDGMNRIVFSRPNKTVRGNFQAKGVMKMLEQNRKTWIATQEMVRAPIHLNPPSTPQFLGGCWTLVDRAQYVFFY